MSRDLTAPNPALLAAEHAEAVFMHGGNHTHSPYDRQILRELGAAARSLGFTDRTYTVQAERGVSIPYPHDPSESGEVSLILLDRPSFGGTFKGYSKIQIGKVIGQNSMRALCLSFEEVKIGLSDAPLPDGHVLHVPALGVRTMQPVAA